MNEYNLKLKKGFIFEQNELYSEFDSEILKLTYFKKKIIFLNVEKFCARPDPANMICEITLFAPVGRFGLH